MGLKKLEYEGLYDMSVLKFHFTVLAIYFDEIVMWARYTSPRGDCLRRTRKFVMMLSFQLLLPWFTRCS